MNRSSARIRIVVASIAAASLVACGGGGGADEPTVNFPSGARTGVTSAGADINASNLPELSTDAIEALLSALGGDVSVSQPLLAGRAAAHLAHADRARPLAIEQDVQACPGGGTVTVTVDDADNNRLLTTGDKATFTYADCIEGTGAPAINGGFTMSFNAVVLDTRAEPAAFDATVTMDLLSVAGIGSLDGSARLWVSPVIGGLRSFVRYQDMVSVTNTATGEKVAILNFDVDRTQGDTTAAASINGSLQLGSDIYALTQITPFDITTGDPGSGQLRMIDAQGDRLLITARASVVDLDLFLAGNGTATPDSSIVGTPWASFRQ